MWKSVEILNTKPILWKNVESQADDSRAFMPWKRENRSIYIEGDALHAELFVETLHSYIRRVVVFAEVTQHNVLYFSTIDFCDEPCRLFVTQVSEGAGDTLFQHKGIATFLEHFGVVVRLDDDVVGTSDKAFDHVVEHSDIGCNG